MDKQESGKITKKHLTFSLRPTYVVRVVKEKDMQMFLQKFMKKKKFALMGRNTNVNTNYTKNSNPGVRKNIEFYSKEIRKIKKAIKGN